MLGSGRECRILEGFGAKLCDFLDEKLAKYASELGRPLDEALIYGNNLCRMFGSTDAQSATYSQSLTSTPLSNQSPCIQPQVHSSASSNQDAPAASCKSTHSLSESGRPQSVKVISQIDGCSPAEKQLIGLFRSSKNPLGCSLQELAACLRSPSSSHHNAGLVLSLLDELIGRGLISRVPDHPGRYRLAEDNPEPSVPSLPVPQFTPRSSSPQILVSTSSPPAASSPPAPKSDASSDYPLLFTYLDSSGQTTASRLLAHTQAFSTEESLQTGFRIVCSYEDLISVGLPYKLDWTTSSVPGRSNPSSVVAYLLDPAAPEQSTEPPMMPLAPSVIIEPNRTPPPDTVTIEADINPVISSSTSHSSALVVEPKSSAQKRQAQPVESTVPKKFTFKRAISDGGILNASVKSTSVGIGQPTTGTLISEGNRSQPVSPKRQQSVLCRLLTDPRSGTLIVPGGSYELVLLADVREHFGLNRVKQLLPEVLQSLGVECESRALPVGDFLWIARWRDEKGDPTEAVLDYVVERKRLDDLAASIVDGRFQEQKYRMKRTMISHTVCLVEECPSMRNQRIPYETLLQAISNGQIVDDFRIFVTRCPEDTVDLLASLTHVLQRRISGDLLIDLQMNSVETSNRSSESLHGKRWVDFVQLAQKSPPPSVRDVFARQLLQIPGCSGPKVTAVLGVYPTPLSLMRAYDEQPTLKAKENMLATLKTADSHRNLGNALSRRIHLAYNIV
ncbi:unnamed protein product [Calicophoron daubneyi]